MSESSSISDYRAVSAAGVTVATFQNLDQALRYAQSRRKLQPGIKVVEVVITTSVRDVYRSRPALRAVA